MNVLGNKRVLFALFGVGLAGVAAAVALRLTFGGRPGPRGPGTLGTDGVCRAPLGLYCPREPGPSPGPSARSCPSYADALGRANEAPTTEAEAGTCGPLKWVMWSTGFVGETSYFNDKDELVSVESWTDMAGSCCDGKSATIVYGRRLDCEKRTTVPLKQNLRAASTPAERSIPR
ncbi:MAG TPA: hypothetical protein VNG33_19460 [Polyangiaceae bacterium]|nr:hypothetical protein [Polyangiaceae bacterium]